MAAERHRVMPTIASEKIRAILFDLDGTLYEQPPLRRAMVGELARSLVRHPRATRNALRTLRAFRRLREDLRSEGDSRPSLDQAQYQVAAEALGIDAAEVRTTVEDWMHRRPLRHLASHARPELGAALSALRSQGLRLGVFSDYPPNAKLEAMGVAQHFQVTICATDAEVNAFKPHPRGFEVGAAHLEAQPTEVLYVGDRFDVDATGASQAGMPCAILSAAEPAPSEGGGAQALVIRSLAELPALLAQPVGPRPHSPRTETPPAS